MSTHKHIDKICAVAVVLSLLLCLAFMNTGAFGIKSADKVMGYETKLFDAERIHTIDIVMDDWDSFIDSARSEEYSVCTVVIDGESYANVGIRGKGNTSLSTVSSMDSDRYSFKIEFDQYDSTKSYYGLDKLSLNNIIQDATYMKDYLTYRMMNEFGAAAPLCSYVYITVNGEEWGLYLAVEGIEDSFLERNYGSDYGELYKPDSMSFGGGRGNGMDFNMEDFFNSSSDAESTSTEMQIPQNFSSETQHGNREPDFDGEGGMGSSDVKLQYIDDNADSYSNIFGNAKTEITEADQSRLVVSLATLASGENIESVVDIDAVLRYFVVHNFVVNGDSYTGSMIHNYYLYEEDGVLSMIPWDYNLAYGTFQGGDSTGSVNDPIDTPLSVGGGDRPMIDWIFACEEYTELYHQYFAEFISSVNITGIIDDAAQLIAPYVEKDPTAFYSCEEFEAGVSTLREFCVLRAESVRAQLGGIIPTTDEGQTQDGSALIDASHITLSDMGSMSGGGFAGDRGESGGFRGFGDGDRTSQIPDFSDMQPPEGIQQGGQMGIQPPDGFGGQQSTQSGEMPQMPGDFGGQSPSGMGENAPSREPGGSFGDTASAAQSGNGIILAAVSTVVLLAGLLVVFKFKR